MLEDDRKKQQKHPLPTKKKNNPKTTTAIKINNSNDNVRSIIVKQQLYLGTILLFSIINKTLGALHYILCFYCKISRYSVRRHGCRAKTGITNDGCID
jgi:hypothetical protein